LSQRNRYVIFDRWTDKDARYNASLVGHGGGLHITLNSKERYFLVDETIASQWERPSATTNSSNTAVAASSSSV
jgi:hypothetical protein